MTELSRASPTALRDFAWLLAAFAACLCVFAINRGPLYYHDTIDYLNRGGQMLSSAGVRAQPRIAGLTERRAAGPAAQSDQNGPAKTADVSRSLVYAVVLAAFAALGMLEGMVLLNAAAAVLAVWLAARVIVRTCGGVTTGKDTEAPPLVFAAVVAGLLGSLGFYVASLMPDVFAPLLLIVAAIVTGFGARMTGIELGAAFALGLAAVLVHNSHILIAALLVPITLVGALLVGGPRRWLAPCLVAALALAGFAQVEVQNLAVRKVEHAQAVYLPFLTARLIQDGPGRAYLAAHCADLAIATCSLWTALSPPGDPMRFTASNITFNRTPALGSFRLLPEAQQRAVAQGQVRFFLAVLRDRPIETAAAIGTNVVRQLTMNSIDMTLPDEEIRARMAGQGGLALSSWEGQLARGDGWITAANGLHDALYLAALVAVIALSALPATPRPLRVFLWAVLAGIAVNALVCGAVSQPAARYGARVIWLLPVAATIAGGVLFRRRTAR